MTAARRMKYEMTKAERTRRRAGPRTIEQQMEDMDLPESDRAEVRRFQAFLADAHLPLAEQIDKHGADYLGFTAAEVESIRTAASMAEQKGGDHA
jgi:hypothetical protein